MDQGVEIRASRETDEGDLAALYGDAFPDEDLLPLVRALLKEGTKVLSRVAVADGRVVGHAVFTHCGIAGRREKAALLGPLAVAPDVQGQGIGGALVHDGVQRLRTAGVVQVHVLGDPAYYGRFGFLADGRVVPPYALPPQWQGAWQCLSLRAGRGPVAGTLTVPRPWRQPALWLP